LIRKKWWIWWWWWSSKHAIDSLWRPRIWGRKKKSFDVLMSRKRFGGEREIIRSNKVVGGLLLPHIKLQKIVFSYWCGGLWEEWYVQYIGKKKVRNVIKLKIVYFVTFMCHNRIVYLCLSKIKWKRGSWKILIKYRKEQVISNKNL
jgi:hypothetical protein